ncbi:hypothetical protein ZIOFF_034749 [Zingiber officinale]|uniref:PIK-related kinase FAT domain-containing protein n=1 Tax=Zingiber officinale TaxID=94328 RepID=A0A8J5G7V3_ZINOF|nr:hypothetical protein ZIOFF_034749 [Zingiber officinale]
MGRRKSGGTKAEADGQKSHGLALGTACVEGDRMGVDGEEMDEKAESSNLDDSPLMRGQHQRRLLLRSYPHFGTAHFGTAKWMYKSGKIYFNKTLKASTNAHSMTPIVPGNAPNSSIPLLARAYLQLGTWKRALSPILDDDSIQEILVPLKNAAHYAKAWAKAWHMWALFNTAVIPHYTLRGCPDVAAKYVVAAVTGYFYSIACASTAKGGVDDSLQLFHVKKNQEKEKENVFGVAHWCTLNDHQMETKALTEEAISMAEKKMNMSLDDIIKMSKKNAAKGKRPPRPPIKNNGFQNRNPSHGNAVLHGFMDSRSSIRQGVLAKRRSNVHGNQFPVITEMARKAAAISVQNRMRNPNGRCVLTPLQRSADADSDIKDHLRGPLAQGSSKEEVVVALEVVFIRDKGTLAQGNGKEEVALVVVLMVGVVLLIDRLQLTDFAK